MKTILNNNFRRIVLATLFVISFGCTEVVDVELNSADPKIVIEGSITESVDQAERYNIATVRLSKTIDYFNPKDFPKVTNAIVEISDSEGNTKTLTEVSQGLYQAHGISSKFGGKYTLNVEVENKFYEAKSELVKPLQLDSLSHFTNKIDGMDGDVITYYFKDDPNKEDYAQAKLYVNGKQILLDSFDLYSDQYVNGREIDIGIQFLDDTTSATGDRLVKGDVVEIELVSFNKSAYTYFDVLDDLINTDGEGINFGGNAIPDNPPTNLTNDALGYFGAYSVSRKSITIK
ncbi:MAG: DUF4249 domain-containing protein [Melioribacteraceae bacterium]